MKLLVVINDTINKYREYEATGVMNQVERRVETIELTDEQIKQLRMKEYECLESISITNKKDNGKKTEKD